MKLLTQQAGADRGRADSSQNTGQVRGQHWKQPSALLCFSLNFPFFIKVPTPAQHLFRLQGSQVSFLTCPYFLKSVCVHGFERIRMLISLEGA